VKESEDAIKKTKRKRFLSILWKNIFIVIFLAVISSLVWFFSNLGDVSGRLRALSISGVLVFAVMSFMIIKNSIVTARTLERVSQEKKQTETIISHLINGVIEYDRDFRILLINKKAEEMLGIKKEDVLGKKITTDIIKEGEKYESLAAVMYPALAEDFSRVPVDDKTGLKVIEMKVKKPYEIDTQIATIKLTDYKGNITGYLKIIRDISREKAISETKSEFISIAAHQLRTPLSATKWIFRMLLDGDVGKVTKEQEDLLQKGYDSNERIIGLVGDMLSVARIEEGRFGYEFSSVDVVELIKRSLVTYEVKAQEKKIKIDLDLPEKKLNPVKMDPTKIELALSNLIDNALKYTQENGTIKITLKKDGDDYIKVSVKDSGVGIPNSQKERLFHKFFRGSNVIKMQTEGTGLGLFITKNIIVRHGGRIWVETSEGEGTTFNFTLPAKASLIPKKGTNITHSIGF
jgi:PAS domain S-box-containing protein